MRVKRKRTMFIHTSQPLITSFYEKKVLIDCRISDESTLIRNFLRNGRVKGKDLLVMIRLDKRRLKNESQLLFGPRNPHIDPLTFDLSKNEKC